MKFSKEEAEKYLPKYLTPETEKELFEALADFPDNIDGRLYSELIKQDFSHIFQGDGLKDLLLINLPDETIRKGPGLVLSNTCDISPENRRMFPATACYVPILKLASIEKLWKDKGFEEERISSTVEAIRKQRITSIFFLPKGSGLENESVLFLDRIVSVNATALPADLKSCRLFSLSQYGHYMLLVKLSIHFSRINESIDRDRNPAG